MAYDKNQNESPLPIGDVNKKSEGFLPRYFRTDFNKKFLNATIDQFIKNGQVEKVNDYIGRRSSRSVVETDTFLPDVSKNRENYQLEPGLVALDELNNVDFFKDYNDFLNQIEIFGADIKNHNRLNQQEFYSWDPKIDVDKFVNFREYYWLPNGPSAITIVGQEDIIESTYTVELGDDLDNQPYIFDPNGLTRNPNLTLYRGRTYKFEVDCKDAPLFFRTQRSLDSDYDYENVINNGTEEGIIELTLDETTPTTLFYINANDPNQGGSINILNAEEASFIDVDEELQGKKTFKLSNGYNITNGMKVNFAGKTNPQKYQEGNWYVEGVGKSINLISDKDLEIPATYTDASIIPFDNNGFDSLPFADQATFAGTKDYILINRAAPEKSPWSRYNRWFHKDVIEISAKINELEFTLDQDNRAFKPIIEFTPGIKLYNYGTSNKQSVDLIDTFTSDAFSIIEGQQGYNVDGVDLTEGMRVIFTNDPDTKVRGKIFKVKFIKFKNNDQISLVEEDDSTPVLNETVLVTKGTNNQGVIWYYNDSNWIKAQTKDTVNQAPLFDLFDKDGNSLSNSIVYPGTSFAGNKLFSYQIGTGTDDTDLGFPLTYRTIENTGDIVFAYNYLTEQYNYTDNLLVKQVESSKTFLHKYDRHNNFKIESAWVKSRVTQTQRVIKQYFANAEQSNNFEIDVYDNAHLITDLNVNVFVNNTLKFPITDYNLVTDGNKLLVRFVNDLVDSSITIKTSSVQNKNDNGVYEVPINLERNPNNDILPSFTFGEVLDHALSIVEEAPTFTGIFPGVGNLRDIPDSIFYGKKVVQHSAPFSLAGYHILDKDANIIKALKYAKREYAKFKRLLLLTANNVSYDGLAKTHLDIILQNIVKNKTKEMPFYFSDMLSFKAKNVIEYKIKDSRIKNYPMTREFNLSTSSDKSVMVYLDNELLLHERDYTFNEDFIIISKALQRGQELCVEEYETTNGSFIPPTPTKLGLYPAYEPKIFVDTTYQTPTTVIQGHDGSITKAYNDFRDDLILEFEKRIYNNIKVAYDKTLFDYDELIQSFDRKQGLPIASINKSLTQDFGQWLTFTGGQSYQNNSYYNIDNAFTYNYNHCTLFNGDKSPGFWRGIFKYVYDTDRPHTHPWEMLGLTVKPSWWEEQYGPAPYTDGNLVLWEDLSNGKLKQPNKPVKVFKNKIRSWLLSHIPVTENGTLKTPISARLVVGYSELLGTNDFIFSDQSPVENAWRRSSEYPFALLTSMIVNYPHKIFASAFDKSRQIKNAQDQIVYEPTSLRIQLKDLVFPNKPSDTTKFNTVGLVNYIQNFLASKNQTPVDNYQTTLKNLQINLVSKLGGFSNKDNFKLILDSRTPLNKGNVFVPAENYKISLNKSSPISEVVYSGVIIEKLISGYSVRGYDKEKSSFYINEYKETVSDSSIAVGGVSDTYSDWRAINWSEGQIVLYNGSYFRALSNIQPGAFNPDEWQQLPELPIVGGARAIFRKSHFSNVIEVPYGSVFNNLQSVVDFLLGYQSYLKSQGFVFDEFDGETGEVYNWKTSAKEFMFWTLQNWEVGSVITLSPAASKLTYSNEFAIIDDVFDPFYGNLLFKADGNNLSKEFVTTFREDNVFKIQTQNTKDGIYFCKVYPVQKEHVLILDNTTRFNDYIYAPEMGYRQDRIKVLGYRTDNWNGGFEIPGFIYDDIKVTTWQSYKDYIVGDTVKFKEYYYIANSNISGTEIFDTSRWVQLAEKPEPGLKANWDYKTVQFGDFYDLDTDNFDSEQQKLAQHLIGYQKRQYLENIINDEVSQYKFYQGMIREKGTKNSLTKLFDTLISSEATSGLKFYEEWAVRTGQYGAVDNFREFELAIDESQYKLQPQPVILTNLIDGTDTSLVYKLPEADVYTKPLDYDHKPFVLKDNYEQFLKDVGYVSETDVTYIIKDISELPTLDFSDVTRTTYVWVSNFNNDWDILKPTKTELIVESVEAVGSDLVFTLNDIVRNTEVGEYVGFYGAAETTTFVEDKINRCFKVKDIGFKTITVSSTAAAPDTVSPESIFVYKFVSQRTADITNFNNNINTNYLSAGDKVWIDETDNSSWKVVENTNPYYLNQTIDNRADYKGDWASGRYSKNDSVLYNEVRYLAILTHFSTVSPDTDSTNWVEIADENTIDGFGSVIASGRKNQNIFVGAPTAENGNGAIYYYQRNSETLQLNYQSKIEGLNDYATSLTLGNSIALSDDEDLLVIADPNATGVKSNYKGEFVSNVVYTAGDIVSYLDTLWLFNEDYDGDNSSDLINNERSDITAIGSIPADVNGSASLLNEQGAIFIFKQVSPRFYELKTSTTSRYPQESELFGKTIKIVKVNDNYEIYVSAPGTKRIYILEYNNSTNTLSYREDTSFKGEFNSLQKYYKDDIVLYVPQLGNPNITGTELYKAKTVVTPGNFNLANWELINDDINILGYVPNNSLPVLNDDSTVLSDEERETFGDSFAVSADGEVLAVGITNYPKYEASTVYSVGDIVSNNGKVYKALGSILPIKEQVLYLTSATDTEISNNIFAKLTIPIGALVTQNVSGATGTVKSQVIDSNRIILTNVTGVFDTTNPINITIQDSSAPETLWHQEDITSIASIVDMPDADTTVTNSWQEVAAEKVAIYRKNNTRITLSETISGTVENQGFGSKVALSDDGKTLIIGAPYADNGTLENSGKIYLYKWKNLSWSLEQTIEAPQDLRDQEFGLNFEFNENNLFVLTTGTYRYDPLDLDFTMDGKFTRIGTINNDTTNLNVYDQFENGLLYSGQIVLDGSNVTNFTLSSGVNHVYVGLPYSGLENDLGTIYDIRKAPNTNSWKVIKQSSEIVDTSKIKTSFVYNTRTKNFISQVDYIDVLQGKIAAPLEQEIDFKTYYDPAVYDIGTSDVVVDSDQSWGKNQVGKVWWNLNSSKFYNPYQGDIAYKTNNWNKIFPGYSVEVCEWVETTLLPSQWNALTNTNQGYVQGITGTTKYGDDVYATGRIYNPESSSFTTNYYYWISNKRTLPETNFYRQLTAQEIALMIEDPAGQGYRFVALLGNNEFAMYNMGSLFSGKEHALNFSYYTNDNTQSNIHTQYQIFTDGLNTSVPNDQLKEKWFDSLIGSDKFIREVPNRNLSEKQKYGTLNIPRQSMFTNRFEARKEFFERVNWILSKQVIIDDYDLSTLLKRDELPDIRENKYDVAIDSTFELININLETFKTAEISISLLEGKINKIEITNPGKGYITAPTVIISGDGQNAEVQTVIQNGQVTDVVIVNKGQNYNVISPVVRDFTVLVNADSSISNRWALYTYDTTEGKWKRGLTQSFDNTLYWTYTDWYANGYNELTSIDFVTANTYELAKIDDNIGDLIKVDSIGTGGWILLRKVDNTGLDNSIDYQTIGRQNGTIQFNSSLWDYTQQQVGFDLESYDTQLYDNEPTLEMRSILNALCDNIFVDELLIEWNQLFLASIRYAFSEQRYIDWAFKTSFVKAEHNLGELKQKITYQNDNLESYEDYVREVKPYKTKIREYLSTYEKVTNTNTVVTDFDIIPVFNSDTGRIETPKIQLIDGELFGEENVLNRINQSWVQNVGFSVTQIDVIDGGTGYTYVPKVTIVGNSTVTATANAIMRNGEIIAIEVVNSGSGYLTLPTVVIDDPTGEGNRRPRLAARIGNSVVRSITDSLKFDRITSTPVFDSIDLTQTILGKDSQVTYQLNSEMDLLKSNVSVIIDGVELLTSEYTYGNITVDNTIKTRDTYGLITGDNYYDNFYSQLSEGTTSIVGYVTLTVPPTQNSNIIVNYKRAANSLNIVDRINYFYAPTEGMFGNDISQLMDGVDYGGVEVSSFNLEQESIVGWDQSTWDTFAWSNFIETGDDYVFYTDGTISSFVLPSNFVLEQGVEYNIYIDGIRVDDTRYDGTTSMLLTNNPKAFMAPVVGSGETSFSFPDVALFETFINRHTQVGIGSAAEAKIVIRKSTSDGSELPESETYDTLLSGGDLAYSTASGLLSEDIVIDGDGFVTINTSKGTEEVVPGHIADTLDISVYHRPDDGGSIIASRAYYYDGTNATFDLGFNPSSVGGCLVKVNNIIIPATNYTIDYKLRQVTITSLLVLNDQVAITTLDSGLSNILDVDSFTADGSTTNYITNIKYQDDASALVSVNGVTVPHRLFETDSSYGNDQGLIGIEFGEAPVADDYIYYAILSSNDIPQSQISIQSAIGDGSSVSFSLTALPYTLTTPVYTNTLVSIDNVFLNQGYNKKFVVNNLVNQYQIDTWQIPTGSFNIEDAKVFLNNVLLTYETNFLWNEQTNVFSLIPGTATNGDALKIFILGEEEFSIDTSSGFNLVLGTAPALDSKIEVYALGDDRNQLFERYHYDIAIDQTVSTDSAQYQLYLELRAGQFKLRTKANGAEYVWVFINGELKIPNYDYKLSDDKQKIIYNTELQDNDKIEILEFAGDKVGSRFGYRIFKDLTNKTEYKRLTSNRTYKLAQDLNYFDKNIVLNTAAGLTTPSKDENIPGVIYINGERIEYFIKLNNTLRQIRRGTRGTGISQVYLADTPVIDQSVNHTVPYNDTIEVTTQKNDDPEAADSTLRDEIALPYVPNVNTNTLNTDWYRDTVPATHGQCDEIEVFVAGKRLRKVPHIVYDPVTETNITYEAEFSVNGYNYGTTENPIGRVRITNLDPTKIIDVKVVRKTGKTWADSGVKLANAEGIIPQFIRNTTQDLPE